MLMKNENESHSLALVLLEIHGISTKTLVNIMFTSNYMIPMPMGRYSSTEN